MLVPVSTPCIREFMSALKTRCSVTQVLIPMCHAGSETGHRLRTEFVRTVCTGSRRPASQAARAADQGLTQAGRRSGPRALAQAHGRTPNGCSPADDATHEEAPGRHDEWQIQGFDVEGDDQGVPPGGALGRSGMVGAIQTTFVRAEPSSWGMPGQGRSDGGVLHLDRAALIEADRLPELLEMVGRSAMCGNDGGNVHQLGRMLERHAYRKLRRFCGGAASQLKVLQRRPYPSRSALWIPRRGRRPAASS